MGSCWSEELLDKFSGSYCARLVPLRKRFVSPEHNISCSPDARWIATWTELEKRDPEAKTPYVRCLEIWSLPNLKMVKSFQWQHINATLCTWSNDGRYFLTDDTLDGGSPSSAKRKAEDIEREGVVFDCQTDWRVVSRIPSQCLQFSPDGSRVLAFDGIYEAATGALIKPLTAPRDPFGPPIRKIKYPQQTYSPCGRFIVHGHGESALELLDGKTGKKGMIFNCAMWPAPLPMSFSPDGKWMLAPWVTGDLTIRCTETGAVLTVTAAIPFGTSFSPDSRYVAVPCVADCVSVLALAQSCSGGETEALAELTQVDTFRTSWRFDGEQLAAVAKNGTFTLWDFTKERFHGKLSATCDMFSYSPSSTRAVFTLSGVVTVIDTDTATKYRVMHTEPHRLAAAPRWTSDSAWLALLRTPEQAKDQLVLSLDYVSVEGCLEAHLPNYLFDWGMRSRICAFMAQDSLQL